MYDLCLYFLECQPGTYGPSCLYNCIGNCLNDKPCNITTGRCDAGCKPGYMGDMCDTGISKQWDICLFKTIFIKFGNFCVHNYKTSKTIFHFSVWSKQWQGQL